MGYRVHVVKRQEEYGDREGFNWSQEEFDTLLNSLGCNTNPSEDYSRNECYAEEYKTALKILKAYKKHGRTPETEKLWDEADADMDEAIDLIGTLFNSIDDAIEILQDYYDERDKKSDWIMFVSW
jgi:hypothetical protein